MVLFDAAGEVIASLTVPDPSPDYLYDEAAETPVLALAWHPSGSHLAVLPRGHSFAMVWSAEGGTARVDGSVKVGADAEAVHAGVRHASARWAHPAHAASHLSILLPTNVRKVLLQPVEVTALAWCPTALQLALGTANGGGVVYDCARFARGG